MWCTTQIPPSTFQGLCVHLMGVLLRQPLATSVQCFCGLSRRERKTALLGVLPLSSVPHIHPQIPTGYKGWFPSLPMHPTPFLRGCSEEHPPWEFLAWYYPHIRNFFLKTNIWRKGWVHEEIWTFKKQRWREQHKNVTTVLTELKKQTGNMIKHWYPFYKELALQ